MVRPQGPGSTEGVSEEPGAIHLDSTGLSAIQWARRAWNHVRARHIGRNAQASRFRTTDPRRIQRDADRVVRSPDRIAQQADGRALYERDMGRQVGSRGETHQRVVVDDDMNGVTTFPAFGFRDLNGLVLALLTPLSADLALAYADYFLGAAQDAGASECRDGRPVGGDELAGEFTGTIGAFNRR